MRFFRVIYTYKLIKEALAMITKYIALILMLLLTLVAVGVFVVAIQLAMPMATIFSFIVMVMQVYAINGLILSIR